MRLINADELITAFPCGESVRTESVRATINHMPTIKVRTGEWINYCQDGISHFVGTCSACGRRNDIPPIESAHYCPSCGAKMKEVYDE